MKVRFKALSRCSSNRSAGASSAAVTQSRAWPYVKFAAGILTGFAAVVAMYALSTTEAHAQDVPAGAIDSGLAATLGAQRDALATNAKALLAPVLGQVPQLSQDVPPQVLDAAQKLLDPSKKYVVQNLSAGQGNPDADSMASLKTVIFISESMPHATLQALFAQASGRKDVAFILRGWTPPKFRELIGAIKKDMPKGKPEANVFIDPQAFEQYGVDIVPVTIHERSSNHHWYQITGEISVDGAIDQIEHGHAGRVVGNTYPVAEPDILAVIRERMRRVDWNKQIKHAVDDARQAPFNGVEMPVSTKTASHLFDPSVTLSRDVTNPANGQIIAARGTRINPLQMQAFPYTVIAFDPYDPLQLRWAAEVVKRNPNTLAYVTRNAMHSDGRATWDVIGTRTFTLDEKAASRFDIESVPTMVRQEGLSMRVSTYTPTSLAAAVQHTGN
ncbi:TrbC family F-type conjugative pilus assembly protein [Burkholderia cenocepacia]|uniref:TrbC family F-type conjugative pilus assembly protein n=1 Tax=Burkholderia cenocepacia TaxID=95486 RepID=UPI00201353F8|nr:TrbC family F-type conjugative pilus assembly protein [Burkholderia cenocepacia]